MNDFLNDLCAWLKTDVWGKKILFTRNRVAGHQILRMAAAHDSPALNGIWKSIFHFRAEIFRWVNTGQPIFPHVIIA